MKGRAKPTKAWTFTLSRGQIEAVWLGCLLLARSTEGDLAEEAAGILRLLEQTRAAEVQASAGSVVGAGPPVSNELDVATLRRALQDELKLQLQYVDRKGRATKRVVWPLDLSHFGPNGAMLAFCEKRQGFRNFRFDRIAAAAVLPDRIPTPRSVLATLYEIDAAESDDW